MEFHLEKDDPDDGINDDEQHEFEVESLNYPCEVELRSKSDLVLICYAPVTVKGRVLNLVK